MARDLETLRIEAGPVSFAEIVARIVDRRLASGVAPVSAQIARSTVYDVFRAGRSRVNPDLVVEIVIALGVDEAGASRWRQRCLDTRVWQRVMPQPPAPALTPAPTPATATALAPVERTTPLENTAMIVMFVIACIGLNNIGGQFVIALGLPLYLDMAGTAAAAIVLGPWFGVLVAVAHHGTAVWIDGNTSELWFALVSITGALVWGYGVHRWRMGQTTIRFFALNLLVSVACSAVAVPVLIAVFGGVWAHPAQTDWVPVLRADGIGLLESVSSVNLVLSVADKLLAGYFALAVAYALLRYGSGAPSGIAFGPFASSSDSTARASIVDV
jgi:energy-coupling factor transport system substrate-specific component